MQSTTTILHGVLRCAFTAHDVLAPGVIILCNLDTYHRKVTKMSVENKLLQINSAGFFVHNLYQKSPTEWRANLRTFSAGVFYSYGDGATMEAALHQAWLNIAHGGSPKLVVPVTTGQSAANRRGKITLDDLL